MFARVSTRRPLTPGFSLRTKYPAYDITSREVDLAREQGETESLKVGSVIKSELMAAAALGGIVIGDTVPGLQVRTIAPRNRPPRCAGNDRPACSPVQAFLARTS